jgi:hypothetical protein
MLLKIAIGLLVAGVAGGIVSAAVWAGPDHDRTVEYRVIDDGGGEGEVVLVEEDGWDGPFFFPAVPLAVFGGVLLTVALVSRRGGGWGGAGRFEEWHRRAHNTQQARPNGETAA